MSIHQLGRPFLLLFLLSAIPGFAQKQKMSEADYSDKIQTLIGGQREFSVTSGRVDILTSKYAIEVEWANKWKDAIGQSLWYGVQTNKKPVIILIMRREKDYKYVLQLNSTLMDANLDEKIKVMVYPQDFQNLIDAQRTRGN